MLKSLLPRLQNAKEYDGYIMALCPFHQDQNPSLKVSERGFYCLGCGRNGSLSRLRRSLKGAAPITHTRTWVDTPWRSWSQRFPSLEELADFAHSLLEAHPGQGSYLKERRIERMIGPCKLGYLDGYYLFPVRDRNHRIIGMVVRTSPRLAEKTGLRYLTPPGQEGSLYVPSWTTLNRGEYVVACYGIVDAISLAQLGFPALTWTVGKNLPAEALDAFRKPIFILPDYGEEQDALRLAAQLGWRGRVVELKYPPDCKDPNDLLVRGVLDDRELARYFGSDRRTDFRGTLGFQGREARDIHGPL